MSDISALDVPKERVRTLNQRQVNPGGDCIVYWLTAYRRPFHNFALQRAVWHAERLGKPLLVVETLAVDYPWASDRLHRFILDSMYDHCCFYLDKKAFYCPFVEKKSGQYAYFVQKLAKKACLIVGDDFPCFFLPQLHQRMADRIDVSMELVDSNGLWPVRATDRCFSTAYSFRAFLHKQLASHLAKMPLAEPLEFLSRTADATLLEGFSELGLPLTLQQLDPHAALQENLGIDHAVLTVEKRGGFMAAAESVRLFLDRRLSSYGEGRNHPDEDASSGLSPWLHFGNVATHFIFSEIAADEGWSPEQISKNGGGKKQGWWNLSESSEAFLDELITWRELGFNMCALNPNYANYESLPDWAQRTLAEHQNDRRDYLYTLEQFERAATHDPVWNAAQTELVQTGTIHNYLRMLWGKKILEWTGSPREALEIMIELNNKYAIDGRDPNSYSGIFWVLGRYDRAWGPERPIYGKIRYMSSESAKRKLRMQEYLERFAPKNGLLFS